MTLKHFGIIFAMFLLGLALYHNGVFNIAFPGFKTVSRKKALRHSIDVARAAQVGANNYAASGSYTAPAPLPVFDTWGGEIDIHVAA